MSQQPTSYPTNTVMAVEDHDMLNFDKYEDAFYKGMKAKGVFDYHIFSATSTNSGVTTAKVTNLPDALSYTHNHLKATWPGKDQGKDRLQALNDYNVASLVMNAEGLSDIKIVEMGTKYRPLIPEPFKEQHYQVPSKEVLERVRGKARMTAKIKREDKKMKSESTESTDPTEWL